LVKNNNELNEVIKKIPVSYHRDIKRAVELLKNSGCDEIYLFGSLMEGKDRVGSDIDLAIRGCNPEIYYQLIGELMMEMEHPIDLINLDREDDFTKYILAEGDLISVQ